MFSSTIRPSLAAGRILALTGLAVGAFAQETAHHQMASYISFQATGCQSTYPLAINNSSTVAGNCTANIMVFPFSLTHGFVRDAWGTITVFDPPNSIDTRPVGINAEGTIAGYFQDAGLVQHGFVRSPDGTLTSFDFPSTLGSQVAGINNSGFIAGSYLAADQQLHGFVRAPDGSIVPFDPQGSTGTYVDSINDKGTIAGAYLSSSGGHGFIRDANGEITSFDVPPSAQTFLFSPGYTINKSGTIDGTYTDPRYSDGVVTHGFVRSRQGTLTTFDPPGSITTSALDINSAGAVTGYYEDAGNVQHGYVRSRLGTITSFEYPGETTTISSSINDLGVVTGTYYSSGATIGFVRFPPAGSDREEFQPGSYIITDNHGLYVDGGFYLYGDRTLRLWVYVNANPSQQWTFTKVPGGFTMLNQGTNQYASDGGGQVVEGSLADVWTVAPAREGYTIKNNRTGLYLVDPAVQDGPINLSGTGSVWQFANQQD